MTNNNYRLTVRNEVEPRSELEALNMRIEAYKANIEAKNQINQVWENYKATKNSQVSFIDFIRNIPESVKNEINFDQLKANLGLDFIL